jgi:hypothetical protein
MARGPDAVSMGRESSGCHPGWRCSPHGRCSPHDRDVAGRPSQTIVAALAGEVAHGRVVRVGRGRYASGEHAGGPPGPPASDPWPPMTACYGSHPTSPG